MFVANQTLRCDAVTPEVGQWFLLSALHPLAVHQFCIWSNMQRSLIHLYPNTCWHKTSVTPLTVLHNMCTWTEHSRGQMSSCAHTKTLVHAGKSIITVLATSLEAKAVLEGDVFYYYLFSEPLWMFFSFRAVVQCVYVSFASVLTIIQSLSLVFSIVLHRNIKTVPRGQRHRPSFQPSQCPCVLHIHHYEKQWFTFWSTPVSLSY